VKSIDAKPEGAVMAKRTSSLKAAWQSKSARKAGWITFFCVFAVSLILGNLLREQEQKQRVESLSSIARTLSSTVLSSGVDSDDMLLKVNDLLNVDAVLGVALQSGSDIPLRVGDISQDLLDQTSDTNQIGLLDKTTGQFDSVISLSPETGFSRLHLKLDAIKLAPSPIIGTLVSWVGGPILSVFCAFLCLILCGRYFIAPQKSLQSYLREHNAKFANSPVPAELLNKSNDASLLANQVETMRVELSNAKAKSDLQARFISETPYPLLRCSINRKILHANSAAKAQKALFGDDSFEFVAPAVSELVRKAFLDSREVFGDIRSGDHIITFRAIPILDAGYVNLYGESKRHINEDI
jgi:hypothetical protein